MIDMKTFSRHILATTPTLAVAIILARIFFPAQAVSAQSAPTSDVSSAPTKAPTTLSEQKTNIMKIRLTINGKTTTATLLDNATSRDFLSLLPMTLTLEDYAATEKISDLPRKLSTAGAPAGIDPSVGDITYYAPWGNLAIFYRDFGYASGLIKLGHIDAGAETLNVSGSLKVTIEPAGQ